MKKIYFILVFILVFSSISASAQGIVDVELMLHSAINWSSSL